VHALLRASVSLPLSLPIGPARLDPEDYGERDTVLEIDHEEAIEHVREVCLEVGFGIPVGFSLSELPNGKVDADRDLSYVLGAFDVLHTTDVVGFLLFFL